jgi:hypothetical protein
MFEIQHQITPTEANLYASGCVAFPPPHTSINHIHRALSFVEANGSTAVKEYSSVFSDLQTLPTRSKQPFTGPYVEPDKASSHSHTRFLRIHFNIILPPMHKSSKKSFFYRVFKIKFSMHLKIVSCEFN